MINGVLFSSRPTPGRLEYRSGTIIRANGGQLYPVKHNMSLPITPGEILFEEYLKPMAISTERMARSIRVEKRIIEEILQDRRPITPELSIRFGAFFGQSNTFWHGIQSECDVRKLASQQPELTEGIPPAEPVRRRIDREERAGEGAHQSQAGSGDVDFTP